MGVANYPILDLILKARSLASIVPDVLSESVMSSVGVPAVCSECREYLSPRSGYRCRSCGRLLCRKCMLGAASTSDRAEQQMGLCNLCFPVDNGPWEEAQSHDIPIAKTSPFISPESPLSRSRTDRLSQLVELRQLSSPRPLHCSTYRYLHLFSSICRYP